MSSSYHDSATPAARLVRRLRRRAPARGQSLVEFAILLPVLLLLSVGVLDGARVFSSYVAITNASREAALFAGVGANYAYWCRGTLLQLPEPSGTVACPTGATAANHSPDPRNIAYRIAAESSGLNIPALTLLPPSCSPSPCSPTSTTVTVTVTYPVEIITPIISSLWGEQVVLTSSTTSRIQP